MDSVVFRLEVESDLYRIASLHTESWRSSYRGILPDTYLDREIDEEREQLWKARFSKLGIDRRYVLLAEINMKLIGFVCVLLDEEPAWGACLDNLHVCPELKGQGLGRQLFVRATRWVMEKEPDWPIHLWVFEANHPARRFYEAFKGAVVERKIKELIDGIKVPTLRYIWRDLGMLLNDLIG
ncbi:MAG: GNAT family N-acetyltransferase [Pseudomonadota bacterium]